jgi:hypothetical protein
MSKYIKDGVTFLQTFHILSEEFRAPSRPAATSQSQLADLFSAFIVLQSKPNILLNIRKSSRGIKWHLFVCREDRGWLSLYLDIQYYTSLSFDMNTKTWYYAIYSNYTLQT